MCPRHPSRLVWQTHRSGVRIGSLPRSGTMSGVRQSLPTLVVVVAFGTPIFVLTLCIADSRSAVTGIKIKMYAVRFSKVAAPTESCQCSIDHYLRLLGA